MCPCECAFATIRHVPLCYREVADSHGVLQQPLKAHSPAGHSPLSVAPVALDAGKAGITVQTVVAAAALQLHAVQFCSNTHTEIHRSNTCCSLTSLGLEISRYLPT